MQQEKYHHHHHHNITETPERLRMFVCLLGCAGAVLGVGHRALHMLSKALLLISSPGSQALVKV